MRLATTSAWSSATGTESEAYRLVYRPGSESLVGNLNVVIPKWVLHYFHDPEKALLFAQILYWFGPTKHGTSRASRRDDLGRRVVEQDPPGLCR